MTPVVNRADVVGQHLSLFVRPDARWGRVDAHYASDIALSRRGEKTLVGSTRSGFLHESGLVPCHRSFCVRKS
jgi:hypothetical protein